MRRRTATTFLVALVGLIGLAGPAGAIPDDGPGADTPGTSVSVSPTTLHAGDTISFRVSGFPAGEIVYVKIDDGKFCSQSGVHGACVVHQQRIPRSGPVVGSLVLPSDLAAGRHWLRFLASKELYAADGSYQGVKGYTLRGNSGFTVVAATSGTTGSSSTAATDPTAAATSDSTTEADGDADSTEAGAATAGATLVVTPSSAPATSAPAEADTTLTPSAVPSTDAQPAAATTVPEDDAFPVVGVVGLAALCLVAGLLLVRARRLRG